MAENFHILCLNGPNLNLLGVREPSTYGQKTLAEVVDGLKTEAAILGVNFSHFQSNAEHELVERIHAARKDVSYIIINPAAFTHTSIALRDALLAVAIPFIEVHLSNIQARESFRHHSYLSDISSGVITGLGIHGYFLALQAAVKRMSSTDNAAHV